MQTKYRKSKEVMCDEKKSNQNKQKEEKNQKKKDIKYKKYYEIVNKVNEK